jgi:hypothetical protein
VGAALAGLSLVACMRQIVEELPGAPTGPGGRPSPVAPAPGSPVPVTPAPAPSPTPTVLATPTPVPTPDPAIPPPTSACSLPPSHNSADCPRTNTLYLGDVQAAINQVIAEHPEYFKKFDCQGCYDVNNVDGYVNSVVQKMGQKGYCAMYDGEELAVKTTNAFNEQFDILTADNRVRSGGESYRSTCRPAWF